MRRFASRLLAAFALTLPAAAQAAPPTLEELFATPLLSAAKLSPDGRSVAVLLRSDKDKPAGLARVDLQTMKAQPLAFLGDEIIAFHWLNDQRLVYLNPDAVLSINADGSAERMLAIGWQRRFSTPDMGIPPLRGRYLFQGLKPGEKNTDIFLVEVGEYSREKLDYVTLVRQNAINGRHTTVQAPLHAIEFIVDGAGVLQATVSKEGKLRTVHLRQDDGSFKQVGAFDHLDGAAWAPLWVDPAGTLYVQAARGDKAAVFALDKASARPVGQPLAESRDFDVNPLFIANSKKLLGLRYTVDAEVTQWLDTDMQALQARIDEMLPATSNRLSVPHHGDSPWVLVQARADVQPTITYVFNRETAKLTRLGSALPTLSPAQLGQTDFVRFKARDGLSIPGYLTLPPGGGKKLPMVVLVHGGPWVRGGYWAFDPEVQLLATRGYAVLQPEFRGSTGYGRQLFEAGFRQWGAAMQDDLADAARWAIAQGHADPERICIAGASYGGYAALMGLARHPELFKCGISWVGVTDIQLLFDPAWSDANAEIRNYGMNRLIGDPVADAARLAAASPVNLAAKIRQPVLLAYGGRDRRVPQEHGERMRDALKPHNDKVEWVAYRDEGHGWYKAETRIDFWGRVERFLQTHIGKP